MITAIDPGVHQMGFARFTDDGSLLFADHLGSDSTISREDRLFIEMPFIYPKGSQRKGDLNDLMELAYTVGRITSRSNNFKRIYPADWKAQVKKEVMVERIKSFMTNEELAHIYLPSAKSLHHNVWDAIGIGLFATGRMLRGGVAP